MKKPTTTMRLDRLLANMGYGSRREIAQATKAGLVMLDGVAIRELTSGSWSSRISLSA